MYRREVDRASKRRHDRATCTWGKLSGVPIDRSSQVEALRKSSKTIVDWCQERAYTHIPCFRLGNRWYHRVPELMKWLNGIKSSHLEFRRSTRNSAERK